MEHGGYAFTLWARKRDLTVEINRILYQLIIGVSFFWWLFHNREYRPTTPTNASEIVYKLAGSVVVYSLYNVPPIACGVSVFGNILLYIT